MTLIEMNLVVSGTTAPPGEVIFEIKNSGELPHEVAVIRTETDAADLPVEGVQVIEEGLDIVARTDRIAAGDRVSLPTELERGHYVLICNISGHYEQSQYGPGMRADFEVR